MVAADLAVKQTIESRESLVKRIAELQKELDQTNADLLKKEAAAEEFREAAKVAAAKRLPTDDLEKRIAEAASTNSKISDNKEYDEAERRLAALRKESEDYTKQMRQIDEDIADALAKAKFPVEGMSITDSEVVLNGLPFSQASRRQRIMASVDVGIALNPKLRLLVSQDGSDLDLETLEVLEQKLKDSDFQMLVEFVTRGKSDEDLCAVVMTDGEVSLAP